MLKRSKYMETEIYKYLFDIVDSVEIIETHILNIESASDYGNDLKTIDAVERRLSIIGEALNKAIKINPQLNISNRKEIIGLRNLLVHNYDSSDDATIWTIVKKHLPILKEEVELLLKG